LLAKVRFSTPPFQRQFAQLGANALPSSPIVSAYRTASEAWRKGDSEQALATLQQLDAGPWADVAATELARKRAVVQEFKALREARGAKGNEAKDYDERLLAFHASLEPDEDSYFIRETEAEVGAYRDKVLARATDALNRAQSAWGKYRSSGGIGGEQRLEAGVSAKFRAQARLLAQAQADARRGVRIHEMLKSDLGAPWIKLRDEIDAEFALQRRSLEELRRVLEPAILKAKLALIGGGGDEERN
jgi:hypothetical protein